MKKLSKNAKKRQQQNRKERVEYVYGTTSGEVSSIKVTVDERTGKVSFGPDMVNCYSEISYKRNNGVKEKVINRVYQNEEYLSFKGHIEIFDKYDRVIAIDTNQKTDNGIWISATAAIESNFSHEDGSGKFFRNILLPSVIRIGIEKITEKEGWYNALHILFAQNYISTNTSIAFIVDSHLSEIERINSRNAPIGNEFYLPEKFKLFYASSDTGSNDYTMNGLIRATDRLSNQYINIIINMCGHWIEKTLNEKKSYIYYSEIENKQQIDQQNELNVSAVIRPYEACNS